MLKNDFPKVQRQVFEGSLIRLEPLDGAAHASDLLGAKHVKDRQEKFRYLPDPAPEEPLTVLKWGQRTPAAVERSSD